MLLRKVSIQVAQRERKGPETVRASRRGIWKIYVQRCVRPRYRMILVSSASISSAVVMIFVFAEKARWVTIIRVNSSARSTVDASRAFASIVPAPPVFACNETGVPETVLQHADEAFAREWRIRQSITRAVQTDDETVSDEHIGPNTFERDDILDP